MKRRLPTIDDALAALVLVRLGQELGHDSELARMLAALADLLAALGRF